MVLLEENSAEFVHKKGGQKQSSIVVSEAFVEFGSLSILQGILSIYNTNIYIYKWRGNVVFSTLDYKP